MTPAQHKLLQAAKHKLGLDDYAWRAVLKVHGDVDSAKELSAAGFDRVVKYLRAQGFAKLEAKPGDARPAFGDRPGMATEKQIELIRSLWRQYTGFDNEHGLGKWLERTTKASALRFLSVGQGQKAINGLQKMVSAKGMKPVVNKTPPSPAA